MSTTDRTAAARQSPLRGQKGDVARDVFLWRRKGLSLATLAGSTAAWVVIQVLGYSVLQVASWVGIAAVTLLFLWANLAPLFGKEWSDLPHLQISEESALGAANAARVTLEDYARRGIQVVVVDRDPAAVAQAVAALGFLSWIGTWFDLLTLVYIGVLLSLTCPVLYLKHEGRIKELAERACDQGRRFRRAFDENVMKRLSSKQPAKVKKME